MANLIGTDMSIAECRKSGYAVMDRQGLVNRKGVLDKDKLVRVTMSNPEYWTCDGHNLPGVLATDLYVYDNWTSFNDVWEAFEAQGQSIKDYCDWKNCPIEHENPTPWDMLHLVQTLLGHGGLD